MSSTEDQKIHPTLTQKIRPSRTSARESVEINAKILELMVGQINLEKSKETTNRTRRRNLTFRDRIKMKKEEEANKIEEDKD